MNLSLMEIHHFVFRFYPRPQDSLVKQISQTQFMIDPFDLIIQTSDKRIYYAALETAAGRQHHQRFLTIQSFRREFLPQAVMSNFFNTRLSISQNRSIFCARFLSSLFFFLFFPPASFNKGQLSSAQKLRNWYYLYLLAKDFFFFK